MTDLSINQLAWLLGLAVQRRRKKEREAARDRPRDDQPRDEYEEFIERRDRALTFARETEDTLIVMVAERDPSMLRAEQRKRLRQIREQAAA